MLVVVAAEALTAGAPTIPARVATEIAIASAGLWNTGGAGPGVLREPVRKESAWTGLEESPTR